jgi:hypothetical protein
MAEGGGMNWFGLNWPDILLNIFVLAIIPGGLATYGGFVAAETIPETTKRRQIKIIFLAMFILFVAATSWQQIRVAEA